MHKWLMLLWVAGLLIMTSACSSENAPQDKQILARINDYDLKLSQFEEQLVADLSMAQEYKTTPAGQRELLERMIREQLLIQEAVKRELHNQEKFAKAIERYWKSTLIRDLMELESREILGTVYVTDEEIKDRYNEMKKQGPTIAQLCEIQDQIAVDLKEEKKSEKLQQWVDELRRRADVEINVSLLKSDGSAMLGRTR